MDRLCSEMQFLYLLSDAGRISSTHVSREQPDLQSSHPLLADADDCIRQFLSFSSIIPLFSLQISQVQTGLDKNKTEQERVPTRHNFGNKETCLCVMRRQVFLNYSISGNLLHQFHNRLQFLLIHIYFFAFFYFACRNKTELRIKVNRPFIITFQR